MSVTGEPGGPPTKTGLSLVDWAGGLAGALSLTIGLHAAKRDGLGVDCDVSLFDVAIAMLTYPAAWWLNEGHEVQQTEKFWSRLMQVLGLAESVSGEAYASFAGRRLNAKTVLPLIEARLRTDTPRCGSPG